MRLNDLPPSWNTSRLPLLTQTDGWKKPGLGETKSPQFICKILAALRDVPHLLPMPRFHFLIGMLSDKEEKWKQNRKERVDEILIENSPLDNEFFSTIQMYRRMLERFVSADPVGRQWTGEMSDAISLLMSFPWSASSSGPVYLH